jgi:hypothetical protein
MGCRRAPRTCDPIAPTHRRCRAVTHTRPGRRSRVRTGRLALAARATVGSWPGRRHSCRRMQTRVARADSASPARRAALQSTRPTPSAPCSRACQTVDHVVKGRSRVSICWDERKVKADSTGQSHRYSELGARVARLDPDHRLAGETSTIGELLLGPAEFRPSATQRSPERNRCVDSVHKCHCTSTLLNVNDFEHVAMSWYANIVRPRYR